MNNIKIDTLSNIAWTCIASTVERDSPPFKPSMEPTAVQTFVNGMTLLEAVQILDRYPPSRGYDSSPNTSKVTISMAFKEASGAVTERANIAVDDFKTAIAVLTDPAMYQLVQLQRPVIVVRDDGAAMHLKCN